MGLLTILKKLKMKERQIRILILGLDNAGKTTILKRLINDPDYASTSPTLGFNIQTLTLGPNTLNIWDVGGQSTIRSYWRNYFEQTDALIWVVDANDRPDRYELCRLELESVLGEERLRGVSVLIFANKIDLQGALSVDKIAAHLGLVNVKTHHWRILPCSAYTGKNLVKGLEWVVEDVGSRLFSLD